MRDDLPLALRRAREKWKYRGQTRPDFAEEPGSGRESVWDYPRPPRLSPDRRRVIVSLDDEVIAETTEAVRVLETASPPTFYLPPTDVRSGCLEPGFGGSFCEWKGEARYWSVRVGELLLENVAWSYPSPLPGFESIAGYLSFYPGKVACFVGGERVRPQAGGFYGGWVTSEIAGPMKGGPGSEWW